MRLQFFFFCLKFIILCSQNALSLAKAMLGENVLRVRPGDYSYVVSITRTQDAFADPGRNHICTGVLITRQDVLTASRCFINEYWETSTVLIGSNDLHHGIQQEIHWWVGYDEWSAHHNIFPAFSTNDIGMIRLRQQVPETQLTVPMSSLPVDLFFGKIIGIAGWGKNSRNRILTKMYYTIHTVMSREECLYTLSELSGRIVDLERSFICSTSDPPSVMSHGDAGNPIIYNGYLIGIHKGTSPSSDDPQNLQKINIHTTIYHYRTFIDSIIQTI